MASNAEAIEVKLNLTSSVSLPLKVWGFHQTLTEAPEARVPLTV